MQLEENKYYHIYNRGINSDSLFRQSNEFTFFLHKYFQYLYPVTSTYCYCLMKNHFHFLIRIRSIEEQEELFHKSRAERLNNSVNFDFYGFQQESFKPLNTSRQFSHLFNCYARNYNTWYNRTGKLFEQSFKRVVIENEDYLRYLVCYIHCNPIHHKIAGGYQRYPYSSYGKLDRKESKLLDNTFIHEWFGGIKNFRKAHSDTQMVMKAKALFD